MRLVILFLVQLWLFFVLALKVVLCFLLVSNNFFTFSQPKFAWSLIWCHNRYRIMSCKKKSKRSRIDDLDALPTHEQKHPRVSLPTSTPHDSGKL